MQEHGGTDADGKPWDRRHDRLVGTTQCPDEAARCKSVALSCRGASKIGEVVSGGAVNASPSAPKSTTRIA
jgi:hypothetical protein